MTIDQMTDAELAAQPAAYWAGLAYEALIAFIRARQAELGFTQPQFWLLRNLSKNDISPDGQGMTIPQLQEAMATYIRPEDDLHAEAQVLMERGWISRDSENRLWITEAGAQERVRLKAHAPDIRAHIHQGIDDADYVTAEGNRTDDQEHRGQPALEPAPSRLPSTRQVAVTNRRRRAALGSGIRKSPW